MLGPASLRDTIGKGTDSMLSFTGIIGPIDLETSAWVGLKSHELVKESNFRIGRYEAPKKTPSIPYIALRDGYVQRRNKAVTDLPKFMAQIYGVNLPSTLAFPD